MNRTDRVLHNPDRSCATYNAYKISCLCNGIQVKKDIRKNYAKARSLHRAFFLAQAQRSPHATLWRITLTNVSPRLEVLPAE
jgi:hypothetical protein